MSITTLSPSLPLPVAPAPRAPLVPRERERRPGDPGLVALALGLLALTSSLHPLWVLASVVFGIAGAGAGLRALARPGERLRGAIGLAAAALGLAVASVTLPATLEVGASLLGLLAALREGAS